jgi:hypothetical protein
LTKTRDLLFPDESAMERVSNTAHELPANRGVEERTTGLEPAQLQTCAGMSDES